MITPQQIETPLPIRFARLKRMFVPQALRDYPRLPLSIRPATFEVIKSNREQK